ncbi:MAG: dephospho-CoA kinase [Candidatus Hydrothermota bacterium]|nr:MAG: dephospho-CoA kinase [Candidatus Hydrothermae bacterium]
MDKTKMVIGVTGIPGSGKTTVAKVFKKLGAELVDMDVIGRRITMNKAKEIGKVFGEGVLNSDGSVDTRALGELIFVKDPNGIKRLGEIVWDDLKREVVDAVKRSQKDIVVIDGALLIELSLSELCDHIVLVKTDIETAAERFAQRSGYPKSAFFNILKNQMPQSQKERVADFVIVNDGDIESLELKAESVFKKFSLKGHGLPSSKNDRLDSKDLSPSDKPN